MDDNQRRNIEAILKTLTNMQGGKSNLEHLVEALITFNKTFKPEMINEIAKPVADEIKNQILNDHYFIDRLKERING